MPDVDFVTITSGDLTARINPYGSELWSLTDREGREYMTDADPAFWTGHAPILFPIVGALNGDRYQIDGESYELPKHGFARHSLFAVVEQTEDSAVFRLVDTEQTLSAYPFAFALEIAFRLSGSRLDLEASVFNPGEETLPFSFGFHPAFAWPLPGGAAKEDHCVVFAEPEPEQIRRIDPTTGLLLRQGFDSPVNGHCLHPTADLFVPDALIWDRPTSREVTFGAPGGQQLDIAFPDFPMLGIWQKPGAHYLCIEPWQGIADPVGFDGDFREKPGVVELAPGESRSFVMHVCVLPPA